MSLIANEISTSWLASVSAAILASVTLACSECGFSKGHCIEADHYKRVATSENW